MQHVPPVICHPLSQAEPLVRGNVPAALCLAAMAPLALLLGSCGGSDDDGAGGLGGSGAVGAPVTTYVAFVRSNGIASVARGNQSFQSSFQVINEAEGGMAFDYLGNLYQADIRLDDDMNEVGAIQIISQASRRSFDNGLGSFNQSFDREIFGFSTTLEQPRSVALAQAGGWLFVADSGDEGIKVFGSSAGGDVPPRFIATTPAAPWDLAYDEPEDRLFVTLADGTIAVYDDFVATEALAPTRTITPSLDGAAQSSVDLRGIALLPGDVGTALVVSDFGAVDNGADGALYVFDDASAATGLTVADQMIEGSSSGLRAPIDLAVSGDGFLRVIDAELNRAVIYPSAGERRFARTASFSQAVQSPRAIALEVSSPVFESVPSTDLDVPSEPILELVAATAPAGMNGEVLRLPADLSGPATAMFDPGVPILGLGVDFLGNVLTTFSQDVGTGPEGGVRVLNRLAVSRGTGLDIAFDGSTDRLLEIMGNPFFPVPKPVTPAGLDLDEGANLIILSDPGRPGIWSFGGNAGPDAEEIFLIEPGFALGSAEPRQPDFDLGSDSLYVAVSNGTIYVYENYSTQPADTPDRTITPTNEVGASQVSTSLAGLVHDAERNLLIVSDTGADAGLGNDGSLYVFDVANEASGLTAPIATITGASTGLDEPIHLAWDGASLWVADSSNGTISRFDDFLNLDGDVAPTASLAVPDVIAVALRAEGLAPAVGGSTGQ